MKLPGLVSPTELKTPVFPFARHEQKLLMKIPIFFVDRDACKERFLKQFFLVVAVLQFVNL